MGTRPKVVIDTNVFISAFGWRGTPWMILDRVRHSSIVNHTCEDLLDEVRRVVAYPKLRFSETLQTDILEFVLAHSRLVGSLPVPDISIADPDDYMVLGCAMAAKAGFVISGDPHLLDLQICGDIRIVSPADFLKIAPHHSHSIKP